MDEELMNSKKSKNFDPNRLIDCKYLILQKK